MGGGTNYLDNIMRGGNLAYKIQRTEKLLDSFNATNNGVIYTPQKIHKGGKIDGALNTCGLLGYSDNVLDICKNKSTVLDIRLLKNTISALDDRAETYIRCNYIPRCEDAEKSTRNIDDILLEYYCNHKKQLPPNNFNFTILHDDILGKDLKDYIDSKMKPETNINILKYDDHCKYKISDLKKVGKRDKYQYQEGTEEYKQDFSHAGYNKDIVEAYEKNFIDNIKHLGTFMEKQYMYLRTMTIANKIIINDYTKKSCFHFYSAYAGKMIKAEDMKIYINKTDGAWVPEYTANYTDKYNSNVAKFCFGDSFFKQIFDVIGGDKFNEIIRNNFRYDSQWENYRDVTSIDEYWAFLDRSNIDRAEPNSMSIFELTNVEWDEVMRIFIKDIDNIIAGAPECENDIYCYRAVSFDYINLSDRDDVIDTSGLAIYRINDGTYINTRIGSFSLNFDSSERYLGVDQVTKKKTGTMYRAVISSGVKVLYIPSLSYASDEFEILHASYALFVDKQENYKCYNNKKNKYGILSYDKDQFNSAIVGLAGYTRTIKLDTFVGVAGVLTKTLADIRDQNKNSIKNIYRKHQQYMEASKVANSAARTNMDDSEQKYDKNDDELDKDVAALKKYIEEIEELERQGQGQGQAQRGGTRSVKKYAKK